jgi:outer membrane protein assembly factor BamE (lipoprotein component of BamABCDE complex)
MGCLVSIFFNLRGQGMRRRLVSLVLCVIGLFACAPFLYVGILALTTRPGIGPVEQAQCRIKPGMSKEAVRSLLGQPHREANSGPDNAEWDYWETRFVGSILRIHFGPDGRVTDSEWWVQ